MKEKLKILFAPLDGYGHVYACIGLAQPLRERGHEVIFATPNGWKGKLVELGFQEECYSTSGTQIESNETPSAVFSGLAKSMAHGMALSAEEQMKELAPLFFISAKDIMINSYTQLKTIVSKTNPDVIVLDFSQPALVGSGKSHIILFLIFYLK